MIHEGQLRVRVPRAEEDSWLGRGPAEPGRVKWGILRVHAEKCGGRESLQMKGWR